MLHAFIEDEGGGTAIQYALFASLVMAVVIPVLLSMSKTGIADSLMYIVDCGFGGRCS